MSTAATVPVPEAEPAKGKGKLLVILVAVFALLAVGGGGAAFYFHQKAASNEPVKEGEPVKPAKKGEAGKPPVFSTLENFTVNLSGEGEHFLQLGVVLQLKDEGTADKVKAYLPLIRSKILMLLSVKKAEDLQSADGKQALIAEILESTREPLQAEGENVQAVLLGNMLIQ